MSTLSGPVLAAPGRILAVNPVSFPGGAETTLLRLLRGLAARGWRVRATTPDGGPLADAIVAAGHDWHPLELGGLGRGQGAAALAAWPAAARLARDSDVVLLNGSVCGRLLPALSSRRQLRLLDVNDMVGRVPRFWRWADVILADTEAVRRRLVELDPRLDPLVVGAPVDLEPPPADPPWPPGAGPVIGFVGRLEPRKGVHHLLDAVPSIRATQPAARIVLIGDEPYGSDPGYTRRLRERAAELGVLQVGWQPNAPGLMRHLDVLVLPSESEPFGTVLAEAMAVGTPVVASAVDGLVEVVEDGVSGRLVPPGDPPALAEAVLDVLARHAQMAAAAPARARRWGTEAYVERIDALLRARLKGPR
ncbi:MAG TPA: glycosyltransferase [Solirubrobacteraceae bacterium]|nr:glycosyltransferase [Solirubrobacteraceae bacterium]